MRIPLWWTAMVAVVLPQFVVTPVQSLDGIGALTFRDPVTSTQDSAPYTQDAAPSTQDSAPYADLPLQDSAVGRTGSSLHPEAREAIARLWSPYCPGLMLEVCPSPGAAALRDSIESLARAGLSADSIVERVVAEYGEEHRALPPRGGVGRMAWIVPPLAILLGLLGVAAFLARRRRRTVEDSPLPRPVADADAERLAEAMRELDDAEAPDF